ncbi:MAG: hypothetical protein ISR96_11175 [Nitrospira sp.]|nr:hypothetical protein [bacterium]MBL7050067.1 hypothetical protein [Nitrospira sp.]
MFNRNNQAKIDRKQERLDSGFMASHFPDVSSIVISMLYKEKGIANPISRVVNFSPASHAFFKVDCLSKDCIDGGFDMTRLITSMINNRSETSSGELGCDDSGPRPDHANITYEVAIQYS